MFNPYHLPFLIRYFDGIDSSLSKRLARPSPPSETTLTDEFCALMDASVQRREKSLGFDADALQSALADPGDMLDVQFTIAAHQHSSRLEAYVSQADFGLILEYQNTVLPNLNWKAAYLMQAKRLFPDANGKYTTRSAFKSASTDQDKRLSDLQKILGTDAIKYCLYTPLTTDYSPNSTSAIRSIHNRHFATEIFDYSTGLALHDAVRSSGGIDQGIWIAGLGDAVKTAFDLHKIAFTKTHPLTWFILQHFGQLSSHHGHHNILFNNRSQPENEIERVSRIASGDPTTASELIDELGEDARDETIDPKKMKVLPASSITISVSSGPLEGFDLPRR